jgi:arylamine N-acetyltransferase
MAWEMQINCGERTQGQWRTILHFTEAEFYEIDFDAWTYATCRRPPGESEFHQSNVFFSVFATREVLMEDMISMERWVLFRDQFRIYRGDQVTVTTITTEEERVSLLQTKFGIELPAEAVHLISEAAALPRVVEGKVE